MIGLRGIPATHGGVEHAVERLSVELLGLGHEVTVYTRTAYAQTRAESYSGVRLRHLPQINTKHLEAATHTVIAIADALRSGRHDVLHIHATGPALFSVLPRLMRTPTVVTVHGEDWRREKWGFAARMALRAGLRIAATVPDRTIVVSRHLQQELRARYGADTAHIPNGIEPELFEPVTPVPELDGAPFVLFLGRLVPEKGVHTLLRAYARTADPRRLVIAGPGTHSATYVRELERLAGEDPRVLLLGPVYGAQKNWLLRNADRLVQPSTLEGMPIVLLEAACCSVPVLASDIPEHLEVVAGDGMPYAVTFPSGDEAALAAALEQDDPDAAERAAAFRRAVLERYRWGSIARRTERVYREAVAARPRG